MAITSSRLVAGAVQRAVVVVGASAATAVVTAAVRASVAFRAAVVALEEGQRGPWAVGRLREVRRMRAFALEGLRGAVVHVVRHEGRVVVVGFVGLQMLRLIRHAGRVVMDGGFVMVSLHSIQTYFYCEATKPATCHQHC